MSKFLMKNGKVWGIVGDYGKDSEMNKDKVISEQYKEICRYKIQTKI